MRGEEHSALAEIEAQQTLLHGLRFLLRYKEQREDFALSIKYLAQTSDPRLQAIAEFGIQYPEDPDGALRKTLTSKGFPIKINYPSNVNNKLPLSGELVGVTGFETDEGETSFVGVGAIKRSNGRTLLAVRIKVLETNVVVSLFPEHIAPWRSTQTLVKNLLKPNP